MYGTRKRDGKTAKAPVTGFRRTPQRLSILEYLDGNTAHPSAEDVYRAVSKKYRSLSFATVYNTLNALVKAGGVRELTIDPARKRFDPDTRPHHHCICVECKKIIDVRGSVDVSLPRECAGKFTVVGNHVEFYGYCTGCRKKRK